MGFSIIFFRKTLNYLRILFLLLVLLTPLIASSFLPHNNLITTKLLWFNIVAFCLILTHTVDLFFQDKKRQLRLNLNLIDLSVIAYIAYVHINFLLFGKSYAYATLASFSLVLFLYLILKLELRHRPLESVVGALKHIPFLLAFLSIVIALCQIVQIYYLQRPIQLNGFMGNSGAFSSYLAVLTALMLVFIESIKKEKLKIFYLSIIVLTVSVILLTQGRAAWVGIFITCLFILHKKYKNVLKSKIRMPKNYKLIGLGVLICSMVFCSLYIFNLKKDSSNGRILIWKITTEMISNTPFFGVGFGNFGSEYPLHQAKYFKINKEEPMRFLANDINHPFNEYLHNIAELGVVGLILFTGMFAVVFYYSAGTNKILMAFYSGMLCFLVLSLFTYPFKIFSIQFFVFAFIAIISSTIKSKSLLSLNKYALSVVLILATICSFLIFKNEFSKSQIEKEWNTTYQLTKNDTWKTRYQKLLHIYNKHDIENWSVLMSFGTELVANGEYHKAIEVLEKSSNYFKTSDLYLNLGIAFENINKLKEAEQAYLIAMHIVPHKFLPKYRLALLYNNMEFKNKAKELALLILQTPAKINSNIVLDIKREMRNFLINN